MSPSTVSGAAPFAQRLSAALLRWSLSNPREHAKGWAGFVYRVRGPDGTDYALKIEREKSPRAFMAAREARNLEKANRVGVGPRFIDVDLEDRAILMGFVEGTTLNDFVFSNPSKEELQRVVDALFLQADALDKAMLDHGQLGGPMKNVLVRNDLTPVILDFEKASEKPHCHNRSVLEGQLFRNPNSAFAACVKKILGIVD